MEEVFEVAQTSTSVSELDKELKEKIESKNLNLDEVDDFGLTALHYASESGNLGLVQFFIGNGANPNTVGTEGGSSPLHHAAKEGHTEIINYLITEQKINPNVTDSQQCTPLHYAARNDKIPSLQLLLNLGADVNAKDKFGWTALHYASSVSRVEAVKFLLANGADKNSHDVHNRTAKMVAEERGYVSLSSIL